RPAQLFSSDTEKYERLKRRGLIFELSLIHLFNTRPYLAMFVIKFIKVQPTTYLLQFRRGQVVREGLGLSFFYYAPTTSLVATPVGSTDVPFIFEEPTADYQTVTLQGQVSYRVIDAKKLAGLMNFTLAP